jgi:hypothetical protein
MTTTTLRPEVAAFLGAVRARLADLTDEQRDELLEGLDADLSEQVAAGDALPDPAAYAAELRAAAGVAPGHRPLAGVGDVLDRSRARWLSLVDGHDASRHAWALLETLRPAWWVARAWIAVTLVDQLTGPWEVVRLVPAFGVPLLGPLLLVAAVVVSVLIGQGRLWPGSGPRRTTLARLVLLAANVVAVLAPLTFHQPTTTSPYVVTAAPYHRTYPAGVLHHGSEVVRNIYAYDTNGQPLTGIQLFDQAGRPVAVSKVSSTGRGRHRTVTCPWFNGTQELYNVFPLPEAAKRRGTCQPDRGDTGVAQAPPLASVPAASATR